MAHLFDEILFLDLKNPTPYWKNRPGDQQISFYAIDLATGEVLVFNWESHTHELDQLSMTEMGGKRQAA